MSRENDTAQESSERGFVIARVFDALRDRMFKAWTEAEHLKHGWGPKGFALHHCKLDLRPGGVLLYGMRSPDGRDMWGKWVFREIVAPERLVFVASFSDEAGGETRHPYAPDWPLETLSTLTFAEQDRKTTITMLGAPIHATESERKTFEAMHGGMRQGWKGTLDQLAEYLMKG